MATRVASIVAQIGVDDKQFQKGMQGITSKLGLVNKDFAKFGLAVGVASTAITAVVTGMKKAVDATVSYADEVRTLSSVTNQSAEETSKMIQVLDDYKLTSQQAGSAARFLAKEGLSLNIETLAELSDKYKALNTGQERAQFLMKNFGKAGQDFALVMEQGSQAILNQGDAVKKGLILTQQQIDAARKLEIAQDNLNDTQQALTVTVGNKLIPAWSRYLGSLDDVLNGGNLLNEMWENTIWTLDQLRGRGEMNITTLEEMATAQTNAYKATEKAVEAQVNLNDLYGEVISAGGSVKDMYYDLGRAALIAGQEARGVTGKDAALELLEYERSLGLITEEFYNAKRAALEAAGVFDGLGGKELTWKIKVALYGLPTQEGMESLYGAGGQAIRTVAGGNAQNTVSTRGRGMGGAIGDALGGPVRAGGWTMVGEQGFELIDPSGNVHSNQNSRRLLRSGLVPSRFAAQGTDDGGGLATPWASNVVSGYHSFSNQAQIQQTQYNLLNSGGGGGGGAVIQNAVTAAASAARESSQLVSAMEKMLRQKSTVSAPVVSLSVDTIRQMASAFAGEVRRTMG